MLPTLSLEYCSINKGRISITLLRKMEPISLQYYLQRFPTRLSELLPGTSQTGLSARHILGAQ